MQAQSPIPVILITGFLGAGKTTFINQLIHDHSDKKISLILNEFGDIKLESQFVETEGIGMVSELASGCLCCVASVDLPRVIRYTLDKAPSTEYLVIEASGLSDPDPVRATLQSESLADLIRLDTVVAIVDALNFATTSSSHPLVMSQISEADLALLSKSSSLTPQETAALLTRISTIGTGTRTLVWDDQLDTSLVFDPHLRPVQDQVHHHPHSSYQSHYFTSDQDLPIAGLSSYLAQLPDTILRVKGYLYSQGNYYLVQKVGHHVDIRLGRVPSTPPSPQDVILFLGTDLDITQIEDGLAQLKK